MALQVGRDPAVSLSAELIHIDNEPLVLAFIQDITERKANEARIDFLAHHDPLTGLPNRVLFRDRFSLATAWSERSGCRVALLFVDLDHFKTINDTLGHPVGDQLLQQVATRLRQCVRDTDTISRQGGDEFLIALTDVQDLDAVSRVAGKVVQTLSAPFQIEGHELAATLSMGVAVWPDDGQDFDALLQRADTAMYQAKTAGRNTYRFYTAEMNAQALEQLKLRTALHWALDQNEFVLHYQPQIELASGRVVGVEALLRWQRGTDPLLLPGRFIAAAEESGLIVQIGEWVLREACAQAMRWQQAGLPELTMAVNLSAVQFRRGNLLLSVTQALADSGLEPSRLELELTESLLLDDAEQVLETVRRFKALGVCLSIDDFGTGYSSLAYLKRFAVDKLKIDQSFVRDIVSDPDDAAIVRAIISMARSLKLKVIAEGVETAELAPASSTFTTAMRPRATTTPAPCRPMSWRPGCCSTRPGVDRGGALRQRQRAAIEWSLHPSIRGRPHCDASQSCRYWAYRHSLAFSHGHQNPVFRISHPVPQWRGVPGPVRRRGAGRSGGPRGRAAGTPLRPDCGHLGGRAPGHGAGLRGADGADRQAVRGAGRGGVFIAPPAGQHRDPAD